MSELVAAMAAYEAADRPRAVCPRCGGWDGRTLPACTDAGWTHHESCSRLRYTADICDTCHATEGTEP